jgi:fatty acid synthase subunit alpha, fungi type/fatty acid synthase subunit beta, fungi type
MVGPLIAFCSGWVYSLCTGSDLSKLTTSLTRSLCDQIFTKPIHWSEATRFPPTATHAVDFGPGGLSGIGSLTVRNLEGRGVRVIVLGEKGKGGSELYNAESVKYEEWWSRKFKPRLVKTMFVTFRMPLLLTDAANC